MENKAVMESTIQRPRVDLVESSFGSYGPSCRFRLASELPRVLSRRTVEACDKRVLAAHDYVRLCRSGPARQRQAEDKYPLIAHAEKLNENESLTSQLQIAVLGELDRSEIAARFGLRQEVLETWESLFFAARGERGRIGWVHTHIICPALKAGNADLAARLKLVAAGGPVATRALLDCDSRVPVDQGERLFDQRLKMQVKFHAACDMPLNSSRDRLAFIRMHTELMSREKRLQLEEKKLEQRCKEAADKYELAKLRLEAAQDRQRHRLAVRARGDEERALIAQGQKQAEELRKKQRREQWKAKKKAAIARAASSPLAALTWRDSRGASAKSQQSEAQTAFVSLDREAVAVPCFDFPLDDSFSAMAVAVPA